MRDLPREIFANPILHALETKNRHLAIRAGSALRYPADVAPFAAVAAPDEKAPRDLISLLYFGETLWLAGDGSGIPWLFSIHNV